ncbi:MAG: porin [Pikeienuella sp.]
MKKVLLGTSALALVGAYAAPANAAEWNMRIGGYFEAYAAYADSDVDNLVGEEVSGIDQKQDAEIRFRPSITLDNGIKIGADVQLEANTSGDTIDESFISIDGSFGRVLLGNENSAGYLMSYAAPDVTFVNANSGSLTAFIPFSDTVGGGNGTNFPGGTGGGATLNVGDDVFRRTLGSTFIEVNGNNDANRFTYFTPRFAGVQFGVSYARDGSDDSNAQQDLSDTVTKNIVDFGLNYVQSFGGFDVALAGRYGIAFGDGDSNPQAYAFGVNLGFAGVTVGGSFAEQNNSRGNFGGGTDIEDGIAYDVGVSYETGPWGVSFTYFHGENVDDERVVAGADEELDQYLLGVNYALAKGVDLLAFGAYVDFQEDVGDAGGQGDDVDGFVIGTGIKISF